MDSDIAHMDFDACNSTDSSVLFMPDIARLLVGVLRDDVPALRR